MNEVSKIDLVVGAKSSPLQLVLSTLMHAEPPSGEVTMSEAKKIAAHPMVHYALPVSLGDSYKGFEIIGTNNFYYAIFGTSSQNDNYRIPDKLFEAVIGSDVAKKTGLKYGDKFYATHGFNEGGPEHKDFPPYVVTGVLNEMGNSMDKSILTSTETVMNLHNQLKPEENAVELKGAGANARFTALLIVYSDKKAEDVVPKFINEETTLMAASPTKEIEKLLKTLGIGADAILIFAYLIIAVSAFAIFISLINSLRERSYDISIMRAMGATRSKIFFSIIIEGVLISVAGAVIGILTGHLLTEFIIITMQLNQQVSLSGFVFADEEIWIVPIAAGFGFVSSLIPGIQAYRYDIATLLAK